MSVSIYNGLFKMKHKANAEETVSDGTAERIICDWRQISKRLPSGKRSTHPSSKEFVSERANEPRDEWPLESVLSSKQGFGSDARKGRCRIPIDETIPGCCRGDDKMLGNCHRRS